MQVTRSINLLTVSAIAYATQYGITVFSGGSMLYALGSVLCAAANFIFVFSLLLFLGGNLLSRKVEGDGTPSAGLGSSVGMGLLVLSAALVVVTYMDPTTLPTINLFFAIAIIIRLIQWNAFEPNGLEEYQLNR